VRLKFKSGMMLALIGALAWAVPAPAADSALADAVAQLSTKGCYGVATGAVRFPALGEQDNVGKSIEAFRTLGLQSGINKTMLDDLGPAGTGLISQASIGSKSLGNGVMVMALGGRQPGCRIILLADPDPAMTDGVSSALAKPANGWKLIPEMSGTRGGIERRAFIRRDAKGLPYLLNLMTVIQESPRLRLFTTVVAIPAGVALPKGY